MWFDEIVQKFFYIVDISLSIKKFLSIGVDLIIRYKKSNSMRVSVSYLDYVRQIKEITSIDRRDSRNKVITTSSHTIPRCNRRLYNR